MNVEIKYEGLTGSSTYSKEIKSVSCAEIKDGCYVVHHKGSGTIYRIPLSRIIEIAERRPI